nr:hypothetical protein [Haliscomenobacter sp.]
MESLFESLFYKAEVNKLFSAEAYLEAMLRFEATLAQAQAEQGMIPKLLLTASLVVVLWITLIFPA